MHRPSLVALAAVTALVGGAGLAACDTDDGRQMQAPTNSQRAAMPTTTSSTLPGIPIATEAAIFTTTTSTTSSSLAAATTVTGEVAPFTVTGPWATGDAIPIEHTCDGDDTPPVIAWTDPPAGTVEMAVVVTDRDAEDFVHYAAAGFPAVAGGMGAAEVPGVVEGANDFGTIGWRGPCPPDGTTHTYVWTVYALAEPSGFVAGGSGRALFEQLVESTGFASADYTGAYTRAA